MFKKIVIALLLLIVGGYAWLWFLNTNVYPVEYGVSFNHDYATSLGLDWKKTYQAILTELKPKYIRVGVEWSDTEPQPEVFDFTISDYLLDEAHKNQTKVLLAVGQKIPRWPECYFPAWYAKSTNKDAAVMNFVSTTVNRYKNHPALEMWQVENEPYIPFDFGHCVDFNQDLVAEEIALVKKNDPDHRVMVTDSGELSTWRRSIKAGDVFGTTLYRVVIGPFGWYVNYDWVPASFYRVKTALFGKSLAEMYVVELQAEPWFSSAGLHNTSLEEVEKSMSVERLQKHIELVTHIGTPRAYLWGAEWWYFMKEKNNDARYWEVVKKIF